MFRDRIDAGERLGEALVAADVLIGPHALILGIPRGGVVLARIVAQRIDAELDVVVPHKIGAPGNPELAIGAVTADGPPVLDEGQLRRLDISLSYVGQEAERQRIEIRRRLIAYRGTREPIDPAGRVCVVVDDGMATGATAEAAVRSLRMSHAAQIIVAVPVASDTAVARMRRAADRVVCPLIPELFLAVGEWYDRFEQVSDESVFAALT